MYQEGRPHVLIILRSSDDEGEEWSDYEVEHHDDCTVEHEYFSFGEFDGEIVRHTCDVGSFVAWWGLDDLDYYALDETAKSWADLPAGRYLLRVWSEYHEYCNEWDGGMYIEREESNGSSDTE